MKETNVSKNLTKTLLITVLCILLVGLAFVIKKLWNSRADFKAVDEHEMVNGKVADFRNTFCANPANLDKLSCKIINDNLTQSTNPNFNMVSSDTDTGLYMMNDDYGLSYYFRGTKGLLNNNVIFGGFQWKILRINGDGSVRLIYNDVCTDDVCVINPNSAVASMTPFNNQQDNLKYVGYVYDTNTSSTIKTVAETWYASNMMSYDQYISDTLFCGDRSGARIYNSTTTLYAPYDRLACTSGNTLCSSGDVSPTVMCANKTDRYTKSDTTLGNGLLTQKVGLITYDEIVLAGGKFFEQNNTYYLAGIGFWTITPGKSDSLAAMTANFDTISASDAVNTSKGFRPVINLSSNVVFVSGDGSAANPYKGNTPAS